MNNNSNLAPLDAVSDGPPRAGRVVLLIVVMLCTALVGTLVVTSSPSDTARELEASGAEPPVVDHAEVSSPAPPVVVEPPPVVAENPSRSPSVTALVGHDSQGHGGGQQVERVEEPVPEPVCSGCGPDDGPLRWDPEPVNTEPDVRVEVIPERPVKGDVVTVRIHWSDAEANLIAAESFCHPMDGDFASGICGDSFLPPDCPGHGAQVLPPPAPGSGVIEFSFTATLDRHGWDHGAALRSIPVPEGSDCVPPDPYEDGLFASGVIEVAEAPEHTPKIADSSVSSPLLVAGEPPTK